MRSGAGYKLLQLEPISLVASVKSRCSVQLDWSNRGLPPKKVMSAYANLQGGEGYGRDISKILRARAV